MGAWNSPTKNRGWALTQRHHPYTAFSSVSTHGHLKFTGQKMGGGCCTRRGHFYVHCITYIHAVHKKRGGCLHEDGCLLGRLLYIIMYTHTCKQISYFSFSGSSLLLARADICAAELATWGVGPDVNSYTYMYASHRIIKTGDGH